MKVLVVGGGGREHALVWKIADSPLVEQVFCAPGNAGIAELAECVDIDQTDVLQLRRFARQNGMDLTVVGPEAPLVKGIVDAFQSSNLRIFGPDQQAARLEGSKVFAKQLMQRHNIATAPFRTFTSADRAKAYLDMVGAPIVVKADGLAAGKAAIVCDTLEEANEAVDRIMVRKEFGSAGAQVVIESCLEGEEASMIAFTDGRAIAIMPSSQDHKPALDGDRGPNTGGMGAYSPAPVITDDLATSIEREVLVQTVHAM
ncbi:MAG: phosphoribosylamine--glycine ligase, partial [Candidatus Brocadiia bacterium]